MAFSFKASLFLALGYQKYDLDKNRWDTNTPTQATHFNPQKFISQGYTTFRPSLSLKVCNGSRFNFWEDDWVGDSFSNLAFPRLYRLFSFHNSPIQNFYSVHESTYSQDFHFFRNLNIEGPPKQWSFWISLILFVCLPAQIKGCGLLIPLDYLLANLISSF